MSRQPAHGLGPRLKGVSLFVAGILPKNALRFYRWEMASLFHPFPLPLSPLSLGAGCRPAFIVQENEQLHSTHRSAGGSTKAAASSPG